MDNQTSVTTNRFNLLQEICKGIIQNEYYAILGPKKIGKTVFLKQIKNRLKDEPVTLKCIYIDLGALKTADQKIFYEELGNQIAKEADSGAPPRLQEKEDFHHYFSALFLDGKNKIVLLLDEIEHVPGYLTMQLLQLFRIYHQSRSHDPRYCNLLSVVISGSANLLEFTMRSQNSPFNIANPVLLSDLEPLETNALVEKIAAKSSVTIDQDAMEMLEKETNGHPYLVEKICSSCVKSCNSNTILPELVNSVIKGMAANFNEDNFFSFILRSVENDEDIFRASVECLESGSSRQKEVKISISKYELCGAFRQENGKLIIRNSVLDKLLRDYFDAVRIADVFTLFGDWATALQYYGKVSIEERISRRRQRKITNTWARRTDIIHSIGHIMYRQSREKEPETDKLLQYLLDGIFYALAYNSVRLYKVNPKKRALELVEFRGTEPLKKKFTIDNFGQDLEVRAIDEGDYVLEDKNEENNFAAAFSLRLGDDNYSDDEWVLSINNHQFPHQIGKFECDELKIFIKEALLAIRNAKSYYDLYRENEAILDSMGEELSIVDTEHNILYMNREKIDKIGADYSFLKTGVKSKCYQVFAGRESKCPNCPSTEAIKVKKVIRHVHYHGEYHKDGKKHYVVQTASPLIEANGQCNRSIKVVRDVTKQKKLFEIIGKVQTELDLERRVKIIMEAVMDMGYKRVRFYEYVERQDGKQKLMVGRDSLGMDIDGFQFKGYQIDFNRMETVLDGLRKGKPIFFFGDKNDPRFSGEKWLYQLKLENVKWMYLPLVHLHRLIGGIAIDNQSKGDELTDEDLSIMAILAGYTTQAVANARYFKEQKVLFSTITELSKAFTIDTLQKDFVKKVCQVLKTEMCTILLWDEETKSLKREAVYLLSKRGWTDHVSFGEQYNDLTTISGKVFNGGVPRIIDDISGYSGNKKIAVIESYEKTLKSGKIKNSIFAPVTFMENKLGIIRASNKLDSDDKLSVIGFMEEDLNLLVKLGEQIAVALTNHRLYESQKHSNRQLKTLTDISDIIQKEIDIDKKLYFILSGLTIPDGLAFNRALLFLTDRENNLLAGRMGIGPASFIEAIAEAGKKEKDIDRNSQNILDSIAEKAATQLENELATDFNRKCVEMKFLLSNDQNILVRAYRDNKIFSNHDFPKGSGRDFFLEKMNADTWAIAPLIYEGSRIGVIYVDNRFSYRKLTDHQAEILKLFANKAALAIHKHNVDMEKNRQLKGMGALNQVITMITSAADLKSIFNAVEKTQTIFPSVNEMCLWLKSHGDKDYTPAISCPRGNTTECIDCKAHERKITFKDGEYKPHYSGNVYQDPLFDGIKKRDLNSRFIIPLIFEKELLGIFDIGSRKLNAFPEFDRKLLKGLAAQIAIAINNKLKQEQQLDIFRNISHSMGTHLTTMRSYTQWLIEKKSRNDKEKQQYLEMLLGDALLFMNSVDEIASLAKMTSDGLKLLLHDVDLNELLMIVHKKNEFLLYEKKLKLAVAYSPVPIIIKADAGRLEEVFQSLMNNAIKFSPENKTINISIAREFDQAYISIWDEGMGIPSEDLPNIFKSQYRGKNAKDNAIEGTGIGLSTVKLIIEKHDGEINVESRLNVGSIFKIRLPITCKEE